MDEFGITIDADGNATATHRKYRHEYEFVVIPTEPYIAGGTVRQNQTEDRDYPEFFQAARDAVLRQARERGLVPKR